MQKHTKTTTIDTFCIWFVMIHSHLFLDELASTCSLDRHIGKMHNHKCCRGAAVMGIRECVCAHFQAWRCRNTPIIPMQSYVTARSLWAARRHDGWRPLITPALQPEIDVQKFTFLTSIWKLKQRGKVRILSGDAEWEGWEQWAPRGKGISQRGWESLF